MCQGCRDMVKSVMSNFEKVPCLECAGSGHTGGKACYRCQGQGGRMRYLPPKPLVIDSRAVAIQFMSDFEAIL
jgi:hypothetical protein